MKTNNTVEINLQTITELNNRRYFDIEDVCMDESLILQMIKDSRLHKLVMPNATIKLNDKYSLSVIVDKTFRSKDITVLEIVVIKNGKTIFGKNMDCILYLEYPYFIARLRRLLNHDISVGAFISELYKDSNANISDECVYENMLSFIEEIVNA